VEAWTVFVLGTMASRKNDLMLDRTVEGPVNYYDYQKCHGTATDKGLASRLGGHNYNIVNNQDKDECYFGDLRHDTHFLDKKGRHTVHFLGERRRKFEGDERNLVGKCMRAPDAHPREGAVAQRRLEMQLAQIENSTDYGGFSQRCQASLFPSSPAKRYSVHNKRYANEAEKLRPKVLSTKNDWMQRRGESMTRSISAPSVCLKDPARSLAQAVHEDARKEATQRQTESAHFAPWNTANSYSATMDSTAHGRAHNSMHKSCSVNRIENHDFGVTRKNNHYSSNDKLTRSDPFFMRPRHSITNNSVKYDLISNERKWFKY
jgi:hypothetical protein